MNQGERRTNFLIILFVAIVFGEGLQGCVTKQPFLYNYTSQDTPASPKYVLQFPMISDQRSDRDIDEHFEASLIDEVYKVLQNELKNTGLFLGILDPRDARKSEETNVSSTENTLVLDATLHDLRWEVPNYIGIKMTGILIGFIATGVGSVLYGGTDVEVNGHAGIHVKIKNSQSNQVLVDGSYTGTVTETKIKLDCDTSETRAQIVIKALEDLMGKLKSNLLANL